MVALLESILRSPIAVLDIAEHDAFKAGPDTFNLYRLALENGPDLTTDRLLAVLAEKNLGALHGKCVSILGLREAGPTARTMRAIGDPFLASYEWQTIRMRALTSHGAVCQCCGSSAKDGAVINVDHIKPRRDYPELALDVDNLQILCGDCNKGKGNWDLTDWRKSAGTELNAG